MERRKIFYALLGLFMLAYIGLYCYLGLYAVPWKDDYIYSYRAEQMGAFKAAINEFMNITPRIVPVFINSLLAINFPIMLSYGFYPLIAALTYIAALYFEISTFYPEISARKKFLSTLIFTAGTFAVHCALDQVFYWWFVGEGFYFGSTSVMLVSLALSVKLLRGGGVLTLLAALIILFAGCFFIETATIFQVIITFFTAIYFYVNGNKRNTKIFVLFWLVCVTAFIILYFFASSVARRMGTVKLSFINRLLRAIMVAFAFGFFTIIKFFIKPVIYVFLLFLPDIAKLTGKERVSNLHLRGWQIFAIVSIVAVLNQAVGGWAQGQGLEFRGESLMLWMMGALWVFLWIFCYDGKLTSAGKNKIYSFKWLLLIISLLISSNFIGGIKDLTIAKQIRAEHQEMLRITMQQKSQGKRNIYVPLTEISPKILNQAPWRPCPNIGWANTQYATYYDLDSLTALPRSIINDPEKILRWESGDMSDFLKLAEGNEFISFLAGEIYDPNFAKLDKVDKDTGKAIYWYTKAANLGNVQSCRRLTRLYVMNDKTHGLSKYFNAGYWFVRSELPLLRP